MNNKQQRQGKFSSYLLNYQLDQFPNILQSQIQKILRKIDERQEKIIQQLEKRSYQSKLQKAIQQFTRRIEQLQCSNLKLIQSNKSLQLKLSGIISFSLLQQKCIGLVHRNNQSMKMSQNNNRNSCNSHKSIDEQSVILKIHEDQVFSDNDNIYQEYYNRSEMSFDVDYSIIQIFKKPKLLLKNLQQKFLQMKLDFHVCQKLYQYPQMEKINFHEKIDRIKNIFFVAQLENGEIIGAFTHEPFNPQPKYIPNINPKSFICNLSKNIFIYAYKTNKTHFFDPNHLIFGNWQIKVKAFQSYLETDWGTNGDCFLRKYFGKQQKINNIKKEWFFGIGALSKKLKIKQYQIFKFE